MAKNITIARLNTIVSANAVQFTNELARAGAAAKGFEKNVSAAFAAFGVGLSVGAVAAYGKSIIDLGGNITDLSSTADMSGRALQTIAALAMNNGVTMEDVARSSEKMRDGLQSAATNGADPLNASLRRIGLSAKGLQSLSMEERWVAVAQAVAGARDKQAAYNTVSEIFGSKLGPKLRSTLSELAGGFDAAQRNVAGLIITDEQTRKLDEFGDAMTRFALRAKVFSVTLLDTKSSFQDLWAVITGTPQATEAGTNSTAKALKDTMRERTEAARRTEYNREVRAEANRRREKAEDLAFFGPKQNADKWAGVDRENAISDEIERNLRRFFDPLDEASKANPGGIVSANRIETPADQLQRIGGMTGQTIPETKKQTELLSKVHATLEKINAAVRTPRKTEAAFGN